MISCPNCGKEVVESAVHCGHCGHRLQGEQKKTMIGMGAVDPALLREQIEQARTEAEAKVEADAEAPTQMMEAVTEAPVSDALEEAQTAAMEPVVTEEAPARDPAFADTMLQEGVVVAPASTAGEEERELAKTGPVAFAPTEAHDTVDVPEEPHSPTDRTEAPDVTLPTDSSTGEEVKPAAVEDPPETNLEGFGMPQGQGSSDLVAAEAKPTEAEEDKGRGQLMWIVGGIIGLLFFCCIITAILSFIFYPPSVWMP
jgi:hypothetical protein